MRERGSLETWKPISRPSFPNLTIIQSSIGSVHPFWYARSIQSELHTKQLPIVVGDHPECRNWFGPIEQVTMAAPSNGAHEAGQHKMLRPQRGNFLSRLINKGQQER